MDSKSIAQQVLDKMWAQDHFSQWLGLQVDCIDSGYCRLHYVVRKEMLNGLGSIHGGVLFAAADSAFAFSCNTHGLISVALDVSITYTRPAKEGDILTVESRELHLGNKTGLYEIKTTNESNALICLFKGTAYRTEKNIL